MSQQKNTTDFCHTLDAHNHAQLSIAMLAIVASLTNEHGIVYAEFPDCSVLTIWDGDRDAHEDRAAADAYVLDAIREANDMAGVQ